MNRWSGIGIRLKSTLKDAGNDGFLVLPARVSGILPKKRPEKKIRTSRPNNISSGLDLKTLDTAENLPIWKNIESLRPQAKQVSQRRFDQIFATLLDGYKKQQLKDYLKHNSVGGTSSATKAKLVSLILSKIWNVQASDSNSQANANEYTIDLNKRDFVLLIGYNGRLLREWAKSGASIRINPSKYQFMIKCSPPTFDWINASVLNQLENLMRFEEVDLSQVRNLTEFTPIQLEIVQRLTNSYFELSDDDPNKLTIYSLDKIGLTLAKRYLMQLIPVPPTWESNAYFYDVEQTNLPSYRWAECSDVGSLGWYNRVTRWFRWEAAKQRDASSSLTTPPKFGSLESAEFTESVQPNESSIQEKIAERIKERGSWAVTATLGYLLHRTGTEYVPNVAQEKIFNTNIPYIRRLAGQLGTYTMDTAQALEDTEVGNEEEKEALSGSIFDSPLESKDQESQDADDPWAYLFDKTLVTRPSETAAPTVNHTLRLRFVPDPLINGAEGYKSLPPVEIWCPLASESRLYLRRGNEVDINEVQAFKLPHEYHDYVSLGSSNCDLRFTSSSTESLEINGEITDYITKCAVNKAGPLYIYPELDIDGVKYSFSESSFMTVSELNFNGKLLQLVACDDGNNGGRRIEANLVMAPGQDETEFVNDSFDLVNKLEKVDISIKT